ncbi:hypoxia induced protein conserved region-domain-containing protein [Lentinula aff. detonsa]|uniref:Hypoxia induced protein conserved region-domain-containing protein n=1 Tax=Lentinula aff. detonsa TaxID=2804958 RepID=A0AA38NMH0_9AGAR|nr:hypoxia induced protein conserved region-domain-containing protein [Lentinula aff. detonsa]KAJ3801098.1 hypoxia induced protein conserved region-domain-containing protein [Lentinula aff. detonsa]
MSSAGTDSNDAPIHVPIHPDSQRWSEGYREKAIRKTMENPWVPLGTLITAGTLTMAAIRLRQGNSRKFQIWLRYRVAFQAFTIFAVLGGLYKYGQANLEENQKILEQINQQKAEKQLKKERAELEQRIADAAKVHEEEQSLKKPRSEASTGPPAISSPITASQSALSAKTGGSWWNVFGWGRSSNNSDSDSLKKDK